MLSPANPVRTELKYVYDVDPRSNTAAAYVLQLAGEGQHVLEIGAGAGSITRPLKEVTKAHVTALEIDARSADYLETFCDRVVRADLNAPDWTCNFNPAPQFDTVIIADVLEHLLDPLATLRAAASLLKPRGAVIVSLPHVSHNAVLACLLSADFEYRDWGLLDRTHLRFFAMKNIQELITGAGLKIVAARFVVKDPSRTELSDKWHRLSRMQKYLLQRNKYGNVYQVVVKAQKSDTPIVGIDLQTLAVPAGKPRLRFWPFKSRRKRKSRTAPQ